MCVMKTSLKEEINSLLEEPLRQNGVAIAELVLSQFKSASTLRIFIYTKKSSSLDECARISRLVGEIIEGSEYFKNGYTLEVSTPGLDRPLSTITDFEYRVGEKVKIEFVDKKRKKLTAEIVGVDADTVVFKDDTSEHRIALDDISKCKIIF